MFDDDVHAREIARTNILASSIHAFPCNILDTNNNAISGGSISDSWASNKSLRLEGNEMRDEDFYRLIAVREV